MKTYAAHQLIFFGISAILLLAILPLPVDFYIAINLFVALSAGLLVWVAWKTSSFVWVIPGVAGGASLLTGAEPTVRQINMGHPGPHICGSVRCCCSQPSRKNSRRRRVSKPLVSQYQGLSETADPGVVSNFDLLYCHHA